jgi:hypothetical protein
MAPSFGVFGGLFCSALLQAAGKHFNDNAVLRYDYRGSAAPAKHGARRALKFNPAIKARR